MMACYRGVLNGALEHKVFLVNEQLVIREYFGDSLIKEIALPEHVTNAVRLLLKENGMVEHSGKEEGV